MVTVNINPTPTIYDSATIGLVSSGFTQAQSYANSAYAAATGFLAQLQNAALALDNIPNVDVNLNALTLDISVFDALIGTAPVAPANTVAFTEIPYSSTYLTNLITQLDSWVTGAATGLPPAVEQAIWDRERARTTAAAGAKGQEALRSFAIRGFTKPPGALSVELQDATQELQDAVITSSREQAIKQADLEQSNRRFAIEQAWKVQEGLIAYTNQKMNRVLEVVKDIHSFVTQVYQGQIQAYGTQAQVYTAKTNAAVSVFRAQTDMEIAEANIRIESVKANIQKMIQQANILIEAMKAGSQVAAQLAASALSAVNLSAGMHTNSSNSASNSTSGNLGLSASDSTSTNFNWSGDL